jgi:hypothetical protein
VGTAYATQISFSTLPPTAPTVTTTAVSAIGAYSATSGGNVTSDNGAMITARGIVWNTSPSPTIALPTKTVESGTTGVFTSVLTSLNQRTLYYVRAYATNSVGTAYGAQVIFTTASIPLIELDSNTYVYYRFTNDSNDGNVVLDYGPSRNHGIKYSGQILQETNRQYYRSEGGCGSAIQMSRYVAGITRAAYATWIRLLDATTSPAGVVVSRGGGGNICGLVVEGTNLRHYWNGEYSDIPSAIDLPLNVWVHVAVAVFPTQSLWYLNGTLVETKTLSYEEASFGNAFVGTDPRDCGYTLTADLDDVLVSIGEYRQANITQAYLNRDVQSMYYDGYLTNFRWIKGQAAYISTYQVPTAPLPSTVGTDLLLWTPNEQTSSVVRDSSAMNKTVFHYATPWSPLSPFVDAVPTVVSNTTFVVVSATSLFFGGNVTSIGGSAITGRGIVWGTAPSPTVNLASRTTESGSTGTFTSLLTGLSEGVLYYMRAYATNTFGTAYGAEEIVRIPSAPTVSTLSVSEIVPTFVTMGGLLTSVGSEYTTRRGVVWGFQSSPTLSTSQSTVQTGVFSTGAFSTTVTGLLAGTTYNVRAYAQILNPTTSSIIAYGDPVRFTTAPTIPTISTISATYQFSATSLVTGQILDTGGSTVTRRGVVWRSTFSGPTLETSESTFQLGSFGTGTFTLGTSNMWDGVYYYVRPFGSNALGIAYGNDLVTSSYLYIFKTHTFTNAGATGRSGPTLSQCRTAYASASWAQDTLNNWFAMTTQGIQRWTVPGDGVYRITAVGAGGGSGIAYTGRGASVSGLFFFRRGTVLQIMVGQQGGSTTSSPCAQSHGGGGGASFVVASDNAPLLIAGGGGGGAVSKYIQTRLDASLGGDGNRGDEAAGVGGGNGGSGGLGGSVGVGCTTSTSYGSSGGGGLTGNGSSVGTTANGYTSTGGSSFLNGGVGGVGGTWTAVGGFGGGGASGDASGGGGGGYSGGGGAGWNGCVCLDSQGGGGGGSYNAGTEQLNTAPFNTGQGYVIITLQEAPVLGTTTLSSISLSTFVATSALQDFAYLTTVQTRGFVWDTNPGPTIALPTKTT